MAKEYTTARHVIVAKEEVETWFVIVSKEEDNEAGSAAVAKENNEAKIVIETKEEDYEARFASMIVSKEEEDKASLPSWCKGGRQGPVRDHLKGGGGKGWFRHRGEG